MAEMPRWSARGGMPYPYRAREGEFHRLRSQAALAGFDVSGREHIPGPVGPVGRLILAASPLHHGSGGGYPAGRGVPLRFSSGTPLPDPAQPMAGLCRWQDCAFGRFAGKPALHFASRLARATDQEAGRKPALQGAADINPALVHDGQEARR